MIKSAVFLCTAFLLLNISAIKADSADKPPTPSDSSQQIADKIIKSKIPVLVDFWAVWCAPCRMLNPIIAQLEKEYEGKVMFLKVNVDVHRGISSYFGISAIPSIFIINNKTVVKTLPGLNPKEMYTAALNEVIAMAAQPSIPETSKETPQQ